MIGALNKIQWGIPERSGGYISDVMSENVQFIYTSERLCMWNHSKRKVRILKPFLFCLMEMFSLVNDSTGKTIKLENMFVVSVKTNRIFSCRELNCSILPVCEKKKRFNEAK